MPPSILITGANGFLGSHLVKSLAKAGKPPRCLIRKGSDISLLRGVDYTHTEGDVTEAESLRPALEGIETVYHLAGIRRATARQDFFKVNAMGTQNVAEAMKAHGARRLVLCGSLAASGPSSPQRARLESDAMTPQEWYGESKAEAERVAFRFSKYFEVTSIRPARILGPLDTENLSFFKMAKKGIVLKVMGPERKLSMVDVDDVVAQLLIQGAHPAAVGEAFFCASRETTTVEQMMRDITQVFQVNAKTVRVPPMLLNAAAAMADVLSNATGKKWPLNRKLAKQLLAPGWECSTDKAQRLLQFEAQVSMAHSLKRSAESYLEAGWLNA
jgi:dihydroflavonol-4-reductase